MCGLTLDGLLDEYGYTLNTWIPNFLIRWEKLGILSRLKSYLDSRDKVFLDREELTYQISFRIVTN